METREPPDFVDYFAIASRRLPNDAERLLSEAALASACAPTMVLSASLPK